MKKLPKKLLIILIVLIAFIFLTSYIQGFTTAKAQNYKLGVTFSPTYAESLGLDWKNTYKSILKDIPVKNLRIPTYWKDIEPEEGKDSFEDVDFMLSEASKYQADVILVLGIKQPRWPECQPPNWAYQLSLPNRQQKTLEIIKKVVERYKSNPIIIAWQVENEPLFPFGVRCDAPNREFLKKEVELVKSLDKRPIILTDSGEFRPWVTPMKLSDIFGTTLYRKSKHSLLGYIKYPIPVKFYTIKSNMVRQLFAPNNQRTIISELQTEPWSDRSLDETPLDEQTKVFTLQDFKNNIQYAKMTGFDEIYLWGIEWWYWIATQGHPEYLKYAKELFKDNIDPI